MFHRKLRIRSKNDHVKKAGIYDGTGRRELVEEEDKYEGEKEEEGIS